MESKIIPIITKLVEKELEIETLQSCIGFDGFVDELFRLVKSRDNVNEYTTFQTIAEFSEHTKAYSARSGDIEVISKGIKLGGNAPIMINALARLGMKGNCIGTLGQEQLNKVFKQVAANFIPISIGEPSYTYAFEFNDGKLMFGNLHHLHEVNWEKIKQIVGLDSLIHYYTNSDLIGFVNWSAIHQMNGIIQGFIDEVVPHITPEKLQNKIIFIDIADPSARSKADILSLLTILEFLAKHANVIIGLNVKEARIICECLGFDPSGDSLSEMGVRIYHELKLSVLVIHSSQHVIGINGDESQEAHGFFVEEPEISTGGGDNFNAGFCLGLLLEMSLEQSLIMGNATASFYVSNGYSPDRSELIAFFQKTAIGAEEYS